MKKTFSKKIFILGLLVHFSHEVCSSGPVTDPLEQYFNEHKGPATVTVKFDPPKWIYNVLLPPIAILNVFNAHRITSSLIIDVMAIIAEIAGQPYHFF